jgi:phasin family protein
MQNAANTLIKAYEDFGIMAREHMEATMKSAAAMGKGFQEIAHNTQNLLQNNLTRSLSASKTMMGARTLPEITDMHQELMKDIFDTCVATTGKISQISARLTQDVIAPIADNANNAIGKMTQKMRTAA